MIFPLAPHIFLFSPHSLYQKNSPYFFNYNLHPILWIYDKIPHSPFSFKNTPHFLAKVPNLRILGLTSPYIDVHANTLGQSRRKVLAQWRPVSTIVSTNCFTHLKWISTLPWWRLIVSWLRNCIKVVLLVQAHGYQHDYDCDTALFNKNHAVSAQP